MTGTLDRIEARLAWADPYERPWVQITPEERDALVEVAKAAQDDSLADALAVIDHALGPNGSPGDALRHVRTVIVKHRLPIRTALARLEAT